MKAEVRAALGWCYTRIDGEAFRRSKITNKELSIRLGAFCFQARTASTSFSALH